MAQAGIKLRRGKPDGAPSHREFLVYESGGGPWEYAEVFGSESDAKAYAKECARCGVHSAIVPISIPALAEQKAKP